MKVKISDLGKISTGNTPSKNESIYWDSNDVPFVKPDDLQDMMITDTIEAHEYISNCGKEKARIVNKDSILVTCIGSIGKVGIANTEVAFNQQINAIMPYKEFSSKYIAYAIYANKRKLQTIANAPVVPIINKTQFCNFELNVNIIKEEQMQISKKLDCLSDLIIKYKEEMQKMDLLVKARFIEMFGTLDLSKQDDSWSLLSDVATIYTGTTPSTTDSYNWDGNILWITPAEISDDSFVICDTERKITEKGMKSKSLTIMPANTVLLSTRAPIGKVAIAGTEMCCNQGFKNFYCKSEILNPIYLYTILRNNNDFLNSLGTGTTFKEISKSNAGNIKVPLAKIELQNEFADFVKQVDKSKYGGMFI